MAHVLGIRIGTRNVGLAVIRQRKLTDFRMRTFAGKWTSTKCRSICETVESVIKREKVTDVAVKLPPLSHCSENMKELLDGIEELCNWYGAKLHTSDLFGIKWPYTQNGSRAVMIAALIEKYPELKKKWGKSERAQAYAAKLYDAVACAQLALRSH